jgi:CspA family cold shock protein
MARGVIQFYSERRGYGFIRGDDASGQFGEIYVHYSQMRAVEFPQEGQTVTYDLKQGERGPEAVNVHLDS